MQAGGGIYFSKTPAKDMMEYKRKDRVGDLIKELISEIIVKKIRDPRLSFITITGVQIGDNLRLAKVFFSVIGDDQKKKDSLSGLKSAAGFIKKELGLHLRLKYSPDIVFEYDNSLEYGNRIERIINSLEKSSERVDDKKNCRCN